MKQTTGRQWLVNREKNDFLYFCTMFIIGYAKDSEILDNYQYKKCLQNLTARYSHHYVMNRYSKYFNLKFKNNEKNICVGKKSVKIITSLAMNVVSRFKNICKGLHLDPHLTLHYICDVVILGTPMSEDNKIVNDFFFDDKGKLKFTLFEILEDTLERDAILDDINTNLSDFRKVFSDTGIKARRISGSPASLKKKFVSFFKKNKKYNMKDCIQAANYHVHHNSFVMNADNFVHKAGIGSTMLECLVEMDKESQQDYQFKKLL